MQNISVRTDVQFPYLYFYIGQVNVVTAANGSVFYTDSLLSINPSVGQKCFRLNRCCRSFLREVKCVHRKRERSWSWALGTSSSATSIDSATYSQHFHPQSSFSSLFPAIVILPQLVIELVCCDISLISPGPDYSIFNTVCYAALTVDRAIEAALPDQYHQSSKQFCLGITTIQPEIHERIVWKILSSCWLTV